MTKTSKTENLLTQLKPAWMPPPPGTPVFEKLEIRNLFGVDTVQTLPFLLDFNSDRGELVDKDGQGTGFTRVQNNTPGNQYQPQLIDLDTAAGVLKLTTSGNATNGGNAGSDNTLVNALETQFAGTTSGFQINARLKGPLNYLNDPYEQGGIFFGPDQDNFVKLVAIRSPSGNFLQFRDEQSTATGTTTTLPTGSAAQDVPIGNFSSINTLDLRLVGDAASGRVSAFYSINGGSFIKVSADLTLTGAKKTAFFNSASRAGIMAFHKNNVGPITVTFDSFQIVGGTSLANRPSITGTRPAHGETNVSRDAFVAADLNLPNVGGGVDASTLTTANVRLVRTSDGTLIPGSIDTTGGGDAIVYQPATPLAANTSYTFTVTDGVKDTTGAAFVPFTATFTTGTAGGQVDSSVAFEKIQLPTTFGSAWTGLTFGPDGKLYGTTIDGRIIRFTVNSDGTVGTGSVINTIIDREGGPRMTLSITFAPNSTAGNLIAYVSHGQYAGLPGLPLADNFTGKITKLTGSNLQNAQDVVVGLPRSVKDHQNYQAVFGPNGRLYVNVSSMSAKGAPDNAWGQKEEVLLSAAILEIDVNAIGSGTINVRTEGVSSPYNPFASNAPVKIYAEGLRSAYDILFHSNGNMYSATNGSAAGGNTPAKPGVSGTQLNNVATQNDYMFRIQQGRYYGHPNPLRGDYILGGGNPTSGADPFEIEPTPERPSAYPVGTQPESNFGGIAYNFGKNYSPNGMIEYNGNAFNGALDGKIMIVRYSGGDDILVMTPGSNGTISTVNAGYQGLTGFVDPLDLTQSSTTGFLYVAEYGGQRITLLRPITPGGGIADVPKRELYFNDVTSTSATTTGNRAQLTITNTGTGSLSITQAVFGGTNASMFSLASGSTVPLSIAAGQSATLTVVFTANSTGIKTGTLTLSTNDPNRPQIAITLRGLGTSGEGGANEPALQRVLDLYFGSNTIRTGASESVLDFPQNPSSPNDEVTLPRLQKAGSGEVTVEILANFANSVSPSSRFGWYQPGNVGSLTQLFNIAQADAQSVNAKPIGTTTFDPGNASFGIYGQFPAFTDRVVYSEDALNTWENNANRRKKVRFYQLKNSDGSVVPNAYVFTFEEWNVNYDQNDIIGVIRNVKAAPAGPEIGLENRDGAFMFPDRLVFNNVRILDDDLPNAVHDTATLRVNNTGTSTLNISSINVSSSDWQILSGGGAGSIAPGGFRDVTVKFVYLRQSRGNELRSGTLTINSDDADEPSKQVELRGVAQSKSEDGIEPSAATLTTLFGYNIKFINSGQSLDNGGERVKVGEEVLSDFWSRAEGGLPVTVRMLAAYHQQAIDKNSVIRWFNQTTTPPGSTSLIFKHLAVDGQSILPRIDSTAANPGPAMASFNPGTNNFGFRVDGSWSVANWNVPNSINEGGHAMRWYAAKDRSGKIIPNTYLMYHDYTGSSVTNYDYQDNIYIISNVKPVTPSAAPSGLTASSSGAGIFLNWNDNSEGNTLGYNIYRASSSGGTYTLVNSAPVTQSQFTDALAPVGQTSFYRVTTVNVHGTESTHSSTSATRGSDTVAPSAPTGLSAQGTTAGIVLNWADNSEADLAGYNVYRSSSSNGTFTKLTSSLRSLSDFTDTGAPSGQTSFYRVTAVDIAGNESTFATISALRPTSGSSPSAASGASASAQGPTSVSVTWTDNSGNETGFRIERRLASASTFVSVGTAAINATQFTDSTVAAGTAYVYRVVAFNASGDASASNETGVTTPSGGVAAPGNLVATLSGSSAANLVWSDNSSDETGFRVEQRIGASGAWSSIATLNPNVTNYTATGLAEGTTYFFRVIALGSPAESAPSNEASVATAGQFNSIDIGGAQPAGSTTTITDGQAYDLAAGGADVWGNSDSFRFAYKQITGDFDISVRVAGVTNTDPLAQAGIMARSSLSANATNVFQRTDASNRFRFAYRSSTGGTTTAVGSSVGPAGNMWLRLRRVGNSYTGFQSTDGVNWTQTGTITINLGSTVFFGFAASSKNAGALNTVNYRNYSEGGGSTPTAPAAPSNLVADTGAPGGVALSWNDNSSNETGFRIERKTASGSFGTIGTAGAGQTTFLDTTATPGVQYTYRVIATGAADSSPSNEVTINQAVQDNSTSTDIASTPAGSTTVVTANRDYNVTAGGINITGTSDNFRFVHFAESGDFDMRVRVDSLASPSGVNSQAGLMARDTTAANSRHVNVRFDGANIMMKWRSSSGGSTIFTATAPVSGPVWLRLVRSGNTFTGFYSTDGTNYIQVGQVTMSLPSTLRAGMSLSSRSDTQTATAQFRDFGIA